MTNRIRNRERTERAMEFGQIITRQTTHALRAGLQPGFTSPHAPASQLGHTLLVPGGKLHAMMLDGRSSDLAPIRDTGPQLCGSARPEPSHNPHGGEAGETWNQLANNRAREGRTPDAGPWQPSALPPLRLPPPGRGAWCSRLRRPGRRTQTHRAPQNAKESGPAIFYRKRNANLASVAAVPPVIANRV